MSLVIWVSARKGFEDEDQNLDISHCIPPGTGQEWRTGVMYSGQPVL